VIEKSWDRRVEELIRLLQLQPHPEGGHYAEVYRSRDRVRATRPLSSPSPAPERSAVTTIYYLLAAGDKSRWHVVSSDEIWHCYEGDGLELVTFDPAAGTVHRDQLGLPSPSTSGVVVVPAGHWQAARPLGGYCLAGCTVAPGFEFEDFRFVGDVAGHQAVFDGPLASYRELL
jgi:predicted cupin superfamily sugar epimerase